MDIDYLIALRIWVVMILKQNEHWSSMIAWAVKMTSSPTESPDFTDLACRFFFCKEMVERC